MDVAWIGLGQMGLPSAMKVAAAGHRVKGFDVNLPAADAATGIELVNSPAEAADQCDLLCLAVFSDDQVRDVLVGKNGVLDRLKPGAVVAIFTTGSVEAIKELAASAPDHIAILDSCFSRMHSDVAAGTMTLLVGGAKDAIDRARPALDAFARKIVHVGGNGSGRAIKLVNNIVFAGHLQLGADALRLAEGLGLDPRVTARALTNCSGESNVLHMFAETDVAAMLETSRRYMEKDVTAAADAAQKAGVDLGTLGAVTAVYRHD